MPVSRLVLGQGNTTGMCCETRRQTSLGVPVKNVSITKLIVHRDLH